MPDSNANMAVTGAGMVTALGCDAKTACAAARAGVLRTAGLTHHNFASDDLWGGEPVLGHVAPTFSEQMVGMSKVKVLACAALLDLLKTSPIDHDGHDRTAVLLNLSDQALLDWYFAQDNDWDNFETEERPSEQWIRDCHRILPAILADVGLRTPAKQQHVYFGGHTGLATLLQDASQYLASGAVDRCIVGGVDSVIDLPALEAAANAGIIKTALSAVGYQPGEAAAFVLLEPDDQAANSPVVGSTCVTAAAEDRYSNAPPTGAELAAAVETVLRTDSMRPALMIGDLNGDAHRASDWGSAIVKLGNAIDFEQTPMWLPALSFGEIGAATGFASLVLATRGRARAYAPLGSTLIWLSSDSGGRAAVSVH